MKNIKTELEYDKIETISKKFFEKTGISGAEIFAVEYKGFRNKICAIIRNFIEPNRFRNALKQSTNIQGLLLDRIIETTKALSAIGPRMIPKIIGANGKFNFINI